LEGLQAPAQFRHLVHGFSRKDQRNDGNYEREENKGIVEHQASGRARQTIDRPRQRPGCYPLWGFVR
jgi:hypothetical protein